MKTVYLFVLGFLFLVSCKGREVEIVTSKDFSKADREQLGALIKAAILDDSGEFGVVPHELPVDSAYWFISTLYQQATLTMRLDRESPKGNRWAADRKWEVLIMEDDDCFAFCIPGGDFFISTGFLLQLKSEYELFYILTFEAKMMNDQVLLGRLIEQYNGMNLRKLIDGHYTSTSTHGVTIEKIAIELPTLPYVEEIIRKNDKSTATEICTTSIFSRFGIVSILGIIPSTCEWLLTRPSYQDRVKVVNKNDFVGVNCGTFKTNGNYARYILSRFE